MSKTINQRTLPFKDAIVFTGIGLLFGLFIILVRQVAAVYTNEMDIQRYLNDELNGSATQALLGKATIAGLNGNNEEVISILLPNLAEFTDPLEQSSAYTFLGKAEYNLGQKLLAASYFQNAYSDNPTSKTLYSMAVSYDEGGNLDRAFQSYSLFIAAPDETASPDMIDHAQQRITEIMTSKTVQTPSP
jgi:tetratricopeptide (TPR) repeat protein